jgi:hypothetical protein
VVRLALAKAMVPQIATVTGHGLKDFEAIPDAHNLGCDVPLPRPYYVESNETLSAFLA